MVRVVFHHKPHPSAALTRPSDALECPHCKTITWLWSDQDWGPCRLCGLRFFNRAGKWVLRGGPPSTKKTVNPKG